MLKVTVSDKKSGKRVVEIEENSSGIDLAKKLNLNAPNQALVMKKGEKLFDLDTPLTSGDSVEFVDFESNLGKEVFWHTSAHLLAQAVLRLYPHAKPTIGPPIENGFYYDFADLPLSEEDLPKIEEEMKKIAEENHRSKRESLSSKAEAIKAFGANPYKKELIESFPEGDSLTAYRQGEFFDLCRGPHLPSLGKIKAVKVLKTAGAYWRGDSKNVMLTRIYAITFPDRIQLKEYLQQLEEAKKRDHKVLGPKLNLFELKEEAPGMPFILPKGLIVWNRLLEFLRERLKKDRYIEIKTPTVMTRDLWERSGHWANYRDHMYTTEVEERDFAIKPMNCPGCMLFYKGQLHSYRDLPLRVAEIGNVHRFEPSGSLSGLMRCRSFHQDDAHIFLKQSDIKDVIFELIKFANDVYSAFGLSYHLELSTKPEKNTIGSDEEWEIATKGLKDALDAWGAPYRINEGDGAFYGPKIDFHIRDAIGRTWQCGTIQLDMALPERFDLEFTDSDGVRKRPIMLHRAIFGSIERFFGILIENFSGRFPLWLSPTQVTLLTVADRHVPQAESIKKLFEQEGFEVKIDDSSESISKKVREAQLSQSNYILTIGDQELQEGTVSLRLRSNRVVGVVKPETLLEKMKEERASRALTSPYDKEEA